MSGPAEEVGAYGGTTPAALLDRARLERACAQMRARAAALGVALRPHVKTHKSVDVALLQHGGARGPITVSTLHEAEHFAAAGWEDITYAVGIVPARLPRAAALARRGVSLTLITDDLEVARAIAAYAREADVALRVAIEIDVGQHRAGVDAESEALVAIARALAEGGVTVAGTVSHAGHSYGARSLEQIAAIAEDERRLTLRAAERLRESGFAAPLVSVGSTPTVIHARHLEGVSEVRPGVYAFQDRFQAALGSCALEDVALSVATRVLRVHDDGTLLIDAGSLALSSDVGTESLGLEGYGEVRGPRLEALPGDPVVARVNQEHGFVRFAGTPPAWLRPGSLLRVLPNHACTTAAAYDAYQVLDERGAPIARWPRTGGW